MKKILKVLMDVLKAVIPIFRKEKIVEDIVILILEILVVVLGVVIPVL